MSSDTADATNPAEGVTLPPAAAEAAPATAASTEEPAAAAVDETAAKDDATAKEDTKEPSTVAESGEVSMRSLVSSKEAGVIIGRGGQSIAAVRTDAGGVKAGVSKVVPGVPDRILSISGTVEHVAKAYSLVAAMILENPVLTSSSHSEYPAAPTSTTIRLLISHLLIGSVIGKGGAKIRSIQDISGARMVASKEMLPQSTERVVDVSGTPEAIELAMKEIGKCLVEDAERAQGTVLFHPGAVDSALGMGGMQGLGNGYPSSLSASQGAGRRISSGGYSAGGGYGGPRRASGGGPEGFNGSPQSRRSSGGFVPPQQQAAPVQQQQPDDPNWREQKISIPSDMVGCIIGRAGTKINEIRRVSGSRISIAKTAHDETGERMFVISGLPENNEKALYLLYNQLESEKERRVQSVQEEEQQLHQQQQGIEA